MRNIYLRGGVNEEMRIEANVLSELWIDTVEVLTSLKLTTPRLRALHMYKCSYEVLTISAPRLEELAISFQPNFTPRWLVVRAKPENLSRAGVASLLTRFSNLRHLSLHLPIILGQDDYYMPAGPDLPCDHPDHWRSKDISMAYLLELELTGFTGTDCELWFMKSVLRTAKRVRKVVLSFNKSLRGHQVKMDAFQSMLFNEGMWASHHDDSINI
ncbi:hypothetical protein HU200_035674 [Digitaria exilis]|uniref:FBD domain-containing protein n=1 Tax=Digitaria exilis TaxID=1010633 RepID=A0A835EL97_9POAL|nr:hypothetical protein HU200_035674 [Digitaria exilis]